jgi:hypothetical protein
MMHLPRAFHFRGTGFPGVSTSRHHASSRDFALRVLAMAIMHFA